MRTPRIIIYVGDVVQSHVGCSFWPGWFLLLLLGSCTWICAISVHFMSITNMLVVCRIYTVRPQMFACKGYLEETYGHMKCRGSSVLIDAEDELSCTCRNKTNGDQIGPLDVYGFVYLIQDIVINLIYCRRSWNIYIRRKYLLRVLFNLRWY